MRKSLKLRKGKEIVSARDARILLLVIAVVSSLRCSSGSEALENEQDQEKRVPMHDYEKTFKPSDYDPPVEGILDQLQRAERTETDTATVAAIPLPDTVQGFRVQVVSTSDIEEANHFRDSVSVMVPNDWVYIVYQTPYYKVRVGDFLSRINANRMSSFLQKNGFTDAWVVPDRVLKPPPPKVLLPKTPEVQNNK